MLYCSGHYETTADTASEWSSGEAGCKITTHDPMTQTDANCGDASAPCQAWYPQLTEQVLRVPFAGTTPEAVMAYFDGLEDTDTIPPLENPELRAGPLSWHTPLGKSLFYAHGYFHKDVALPAGDYRKPCERLRIALFTDGLETCNEPADDPTGNFEATTWATNLYQNLGVKTHTVAIDVGSTGSLQSIANAGHGQFHNVAGSTTALKQAFLDIIAEAQPPSEICNGLDDDCDNQADEDFPLLGQPCDNGELGQCFATGFYVCKPDGSGVVCDAPAGTPQSESCNGLDDNCNGQIDEIPGCTPCVPRPEVCNGLDDDCDGDIDEDIPSAPCGTDIGECTPGMTKCVSNPNPPPDAHLICDGGKGPETEECNGLDDDCDGLVDGMSEGCYTLESIPQEKGCWEEASGWVCLGFCRAGARTCTNGVWGQCSGQVGPDPEQCNGLDDDCDDEVDEEAECPDGSKCIEGQCVRGCGTGEFVCPQGQICKDGWCVPDPCDPEACDAQGGVCKGGVCIDPCKNVTCGKYEECVKGRCVDQSCYNPANACPEGERCIQGTCQPDPCYGVQCPPTEACHEGTCVSLCDQLACAPDEVCKIVEQDAEPTARCVEDPCAGKDCGEGFVCIEGSCVDDPCFRVRCETGEICVDGTCIPDPCETVSCPAGYACEHGRCEPINASTRTEVLASGGGGVACSSSGDSRPARGSLGLVLLALAFLIFIRPTRPE
jgi:MYXO-CTERM domain-containing protein